MAQERTSAVEAGTRLQGEREGPTTARDSNRSAATSGSEGQARPSYEIGSRAQRSGGMFDTPVVPLLVGAAVGCAVAYVVYGRTTPSVPWRVTRDRSDDVISTLNGLIEISKDGERGFRACADGV